MRKLMAAGMINLGKTHTVEFAYGGWGISGRLCPITRDIEDAAFLLTVLQGAEPRDKHILGGGDIDPMPSLRRGVKGLRLGRLPKEEHGIDADVLAAYDKSVDALAILGAEIVGLTLPTRFADLGAINGTIMSTAAYAALSRLVDDNVQGLDQDVRPRMRAGRGDSSRDYLAALAERERMKGSFSARDRGRGRTADPHRGHARHPGGVDRSGTSRRQCSRAG